MGPGCCGITYDWYFNFGVFFWGGDTPKYEGVWGRRSGVMMRGDTGARRGDGSVWGGQRGLGEVWGRSWDLGCSPLTPLIPHPPPGAGAAAAGAGGAADGAQHPGEVRPQPAPAPAPPALARCPLRQPRLPQHRRRRAGTPKHAPSRRGTPKPDPDTLTPFSRAPQYPQLPPPASHWSARVAPESLVRRAGVF